MTTAATLLSAPETDDRAGERVIVNNTSAAIVFLGPVGVTTATGYSLAAGAVSPELILGPGEAVYGIVVASTSVVSVLRTGS